MSNFDLNIFKKNLSWYYLQYKLSTGLLVCILFKQKLQFNILNKIFNFKKAMFLNRMSAIYSIRW